MLSLLIWALISSHAHAHANPTHFSGTWVQDCQVVNDDDVIQVNIIVQAKQWIWQGIGFQENGCKIPYVTYEEVYTLQKENPKDGKPNEYDLNLLTKEVSYTPLTQEVTNALNEGRFCGLSKWKLQTKMLVTGLNCQDQIMKKAKEPFFQSIALDDQTIRWGLLTKEQNGSSEKSRPKAYEPLFFKHQ